jgi:hypothetical protein
MAASPRIDAPLLNRRISDALTPDALLALHDAHGWQMDAMHYGNLWNKLGKARRSLDLSESSGWTASSRASLERLVRASVFIIASFGAQQLANVAHGAALAGVPEPAAAELFSALSAQALGVGTTGTLFDRFEPRHLANLAWGCATSGQASQALFKAIARAARPLLRLLPAPTLQSPGGRGRAAGKAEGQGRARGAGGRGGGRGGASSLGFNEQEVAMLAYAFCKAERGCLSVSLARHLRKGSAGVSTPQLAGIVPSLVRLATQRGATEKQRAALIRALKALARAIRSRAPQMRPEDLETVATAYARLNILGWGAQLTKSIAAAAARVVGGCDGGCQQLSPRHLTNLLWAVAKLASGCKLARGRVATDHDVVKLAEAAGSQIATRLEASRAAPGGAAAPSAGFNGRDLSNAAWALLTLGLVGRRCLEAIGTAAAPIIGAFNAQECSKLLGSLDKARVRVPALETAALALREAVFVFPPPVGRLTLEYSAGGGRNTAGGRREETGATAATGFALWEDALVLTDWLAGLPTPEALAQKGGIPPEVLAQSLSQLRSWDRVLAVELGAGIGLCAAAAARLGMEVVATDGDERTVRLIASNLERNAPAGRGRARAAGLRWGDTEAARALGLARRPELLIATGCVYGSCAEVWEALVRTMDAVAGPDTLVLLVHGNGTAPGALEMRGGFYLAAEKLFHMARVPQRLLSAEHEGCRLHCMRKLDRS